MAMVNVHGSTARRLRTSRKLAANDKDSEQNAHGVTTRARACSKSSRRKPLPFPLLSLPAAILQEIATLAGPASRQLCKELRAAYGSFPTLRPFSIRTTRALLHALSALSHPRLQSLDLSRIAPLVTARTLPALCAAFPHLRSLQLCHCWKLGDDALAALAPLRTSLTHLDISACGGLSPAALAPVCNLTALRHLKLDLHFREFRISCALVHSSDVKARTAEDLAPLLHLGHLTALELWLPYREGAQAGAIAATTALSHLVALALHNQPYSCACDDVLQELSRHRGLTSLQLRSSFCINISRPGLCRVAALTTLRRLRMHACLDQAGDGAGGAAHEWGALSALSQLQALELHADTKRSDVFAVVLESITALSSLAELTLYGKGMRSDAVSVQGLQCLPALAPTLTALHLGNVLLPPDYLSMLLPLTALQELRLTYLWSFPHTPPDYALLARLRSLRQLVLRLGPSPAALAASALLGEQVGSLGSLPELTSLEVSACTLADDDLAPFTRLTRLRQLNLSFNNRIAGPGLGHLRQLPLLEELEVMVRASALTSLLPLPPRLGVCVLRLGFGNRGGHETAGGVLGPACRVVVLDPLVSRLHYNRQYGF